MEKNKKVINYMEMSKQVINALSTLKEMAHYETEKLTAGSLKVARKLENSSDGNDVSNM